MSASDYQSNSCNSSESCITCSDDGKRGQAIVLKDANATVLMEEGGVKLIAIDLVMPVAVGDVLLCHAGMAISNLGAQA